MPSLPTRPSTTLAYPGSQPARGRLSRSLAPLALAALTALSAVPAARAESGGGVNLTPTAEEKAKAMVVRKISCMKGCSSIDNAAAGATLRFQGPMLTRGKRVVYLGGAGTEDDVLAKVRITKSGSGKVVTALLPKRAHSGPVAFETKPGVRSGASTDKIVLPEPVAAIAPLPGNGPFFPIQGTYKFGTGAAAFGGGRGHQGQDVFAKCGTPLVAAEGGKVLYKAFQARAGNYLVIDVDGADRDEAYMHLRTPAIVEKDAVVKAGEQIGEVGDTGRADGCHLHFELWEGTWQSMGGQAGHPIDPLPTLKSWATIKVGELAAH